MKCQRHKIDGNECKGVRFNETEAKAYFKCIKVCDICYIDLVHKQKIHQNMLNKVERSNKYCVCCNRRLYPDNQSGYCRDCLIELNKERRKQKLFKLNTLSIKI